MPSKRNRDFHAVLGGQAYDEIPGQQLAAAARQLTSLCVRAGGSRAELIETLAMVGCISPEMAAAALARAPGHPGPVRYARPVAVPTRPATAARKWLWCRRGLHRLVGADHWVSPTNGKSRCRPCGNEADRERRRRKRATAALRSAQSPGGYTDLPQSGENGSCGDRGASNGHV